MTEKNDLIEVLQQANRGLLTTTAERDLILQRIEVLEKGNPTPSPTEAAALLDGDWRLLYTTSDELLGIGRFPLVALGPVYQCIRVAQGRVYNIAELDGPPYLNGLVSVAASFEVVSDRRLTVAFRRAVFGLRSWVGYQDPNSWIEALESDRRFAAIDLKIQPRDRQGWIELTYLDETLRINRGNNGSVFVLERV